MRRAGAGRAKRPLHAAELDDPFAGQPSRVEDVRTSGDIRRRRVDDSITTLPLRPPPQLELAFGDFSYGDVDPTIPSESKPDVNIHDDTDDIPQALPNVKVKTTRDRYENSVRV